MPSAPVFTASTRSGINTDLHAPTGVAITQSDTVDCPVSLRGLYIFAAGTLKFTDIEGNTFTVTFPAPFDGTTGAGGIYPFRFDMQISRVWDNGTSIADSDLLGFH